MAYIIEGEKHPVIFCANYRCASAAIRDTIYEMGGRKMRPGHQHHDPPEEVPKGALVVESVRCHLDVIESMWYYNDIDKPWEKYLEEVLEDKHIFLRAGKLYGKFPTNYILRFENLDFEWNMLCLNAGLEETPLRRTNGTSKKVKRDALWTWKQQQKVRDCYAEEMEAMGYGGC